MKYIVLLLILLTGFNAVSSEKEVSLEELISQLEQTELDEKKLPIYSQIVKKTWQSNPSLAEEFGNQGLKLHDKYDNPYEEGLLLLYLVRVYVDRIDLKTAEKLTSRAIAASRKADHERLIISNLFYQATVYQMQDKLVLAIDAYLSLVEGYKKLNAENRLGGIYNNVGNAYRELGDLSAALNYYQKALPLFQQMGSIENYSTTLMNIGTIFFRLKDFKQAEDNYLLGLSNLYEQSYPREYSEAHQRLGQLYQEMEEYSKAMRHFQLSEHALIKHDNKGKLIYSYFVQAKLALKMGDNAFLRVIMEKFEGIGQSVIDEQHQGIVHYMRALYAVENNNWLEAERNIDLALEDESVDLDYYSYIDSLNLAIKIKSELGKIEEAKKILLDSIALHNQQSNENKNALIAQYSQLYKVSQKEQKVQKLQEQSLLQQNSILLEQKKSRQSLFIFVVVSLIFLAALALIVQRSRNLAHQKKLSEQLLDEKKLFFADISHELRTPLAVLKLKMEQLEYNLIDDPKSAYKFLHDRIDSFNNLIDDISLLAQKDQGELELVIETVDLKSFVTQQVDSLTILASEKGLSVETNIQLSESDKANIDSDRIRQVFNNLFSNACRYTNTPGQVRLLASVSDRYLKVVIEDSAPGLSEKELNKIFERLYRSDKSRSRKSGGSGLGLSICKSLVEGHNGDITASSSTLGGVKVTISLPIDMPASNLAN
ncbi:ATP-binding protein [Pseudoalteromonas piratica]|uniref:ATP-binding protein n=1 Tax=Pseudoalteromonas piratica TaxID=1348114 RepID=UPI00068BBC7F|nr:ATP-binding protein [Pseudoalteromonas piratica]